MEGFDPLPSFTFPERLFIQGASTPEIQNGISDIRNIVHFGLASIHRDFKDKPFLALFVFLPQKRNFCLFHYEPKMRLFPSSCLLQLPHKEKTAF
jgi:hypothetical protein